MYSGFPMDSHIFLLGACDRKDNTKTLSEMEYHYNERLSSLSADGKGYWVGGETGIVWHVDEQGRHRHATGLDRIYDVVRDHRSPSKVWIASRNAGLQLWQLAGDSMIHRKTYTIPCKGNRYSPYDIELTDSRIFVATSQGLYGMTTGDDEPQLKRIYPSADNIGQKEGIALSGKSSLSCR